MWLSYNVPSQDVSFWMILLGMQPSCCEKSKAMKMLRMMVSVEPSFQAIPVQV